VANRSLRWSYGQITGARSTDKSSRWDCRPGKLCGCGLVLDNVAALPEFALEPGRFFLVVFDHLLGLFREYSTPLFNGEFQEFAEPEQGRWRICLNGVFLHGHGHALSWGVYGKRSLEPSGRMDDYQRIAV